MNIVPMIIQQVSVGQLYIRFNGFAETLQWSGNHYYYSYTTIALNQTVRVKTGPHFFDKTWFWLCGGLWLELITLDCSTSRKTSGRTANVKRSWISSAEGESWTWGCLMDSGNHNIILISVLRWQLPPQICTKHLHFDGN